MMKNTILILLVLISFTACTTNKKETNNEAVSHHNDEMPHNDGHNHNHDVVTSDSNKTKQLKQNENKNTATTPIIVAYISIKNGLVASNKKATSVGAKALLKAFSEFDMSTLSNEKHKVYMEILESAKEQAIHIAKNDLDHQRMHFKNLSQDIATIITLLGTDKTLYIAHCPMANNGKGANWLSEVKVIKNPYYGDKMLTCGSVIQQIN
jgi:hypothetical protein